MELTEKILNELRISKPQRKFLLSLFRAILVARGKVNFRNLSRYSEPSEKTYARQFAKSFDFLGFNIHTLVTILPGSNGQYYLKV